MSKKTKISEKRKRKLRLVHKAETTSLDKKNEDLINNITEEVLTEFLNISSNTEDFLNISSNTEDLIANELKVLGIKPSNDTEQVIKKIKLKLDLLMDTNASYEAKCLGTLLLSNILLSYQINIIKKMMIISKTGKSLY